MLFRSYYLETTDWEGIFLHQPESILVFLLFNEHRHDDVKRVWLEEYPRETLDTLASVWGTAITR